MLGHGWIDWWESLKKRFLQKKEVSGDPALLGHGLMDWWESLKMRFSTEKSLRRPCRAWSQIGWIVGRVLKCVS